MRQRNFWVERVRQSWKSRPLVWLSGVRRIGKTSLGRQLEDAVLFNCDLPSVRRRLSDPESFLLDARAQGRSLVLDEIHRLEDPSSILKIAADEFPDLRLLATGSSTLAATSKFRDTLTGRKHSIHLAPVLWRECLDSFGPLTLDHRLLAGGFPEQLLAPTVSPSFFEEWIDSFFARDIQELFGVRNRTGFLNLLRLVCLRSGGSLEVSDLAKKAGITRPTVMSHLDALEIAGAVERLPPFHGGGHREIIRQPKIYAFDTGLVAHVSGWEVIRESDRGHLWEHLVLNELRADFPMAVLHYWRDKSQREIDFVLDRGARGIDVVEAKVSPDSFDPRAIVHFRDSYPSGKNFVVSPHVEEPYSVTRRGLRFEVGRPQHLGRLLE